jgi:tripartite-type tricarboxylate transporter receptor subunit TctC
MAPEPLRLLALALLCGMAVSANAETAVRAAGGYPTKPVRIIVSSAPGGGQDVTTRPVAQKLAERFGVPLVVDNRGGASGIIAMHVTRQAAPDGYTLLIGATSILAKSALSKYGVKSVSFLPMMIDKQYRPEVLRAGDPRFDDMVAYMDWASEGRSEGFDHRFERPGDEVMISA